MTTRTGTRRILCAGAASLVLLSEAAIAQTVSCAIAASPMAFGVHDPSLPGTLGPVTSSITVQCSVPPGTGNVGAFTLNLLLSTGGSGTYSQRLMTGPGGDKVKYNIYTSANGSTVWGDGGPGSGVKSLTIPRLTPGQGGSVSAQAFAFVPGSQDVGAGDYRDTITVIANW